MVPLQETSHTMSISQRVLRFARLRLGLKPLIDYAQARSRLIGIADLPIRTVFDVGANVGKKARLYHRMFPDARIYCFEPVPSTFERLAHNVRPFSGAILPYQLALGSESGRARMLWNQTHSGGSTLTCDRRTSAAHEVTREIDVPVSTLDEVASALPLEDDILVKIDVEGHDLEVIRGGTEVLGRAAAVIVEVPILDAPADRPGMREFILELSDLGYMYRGNLACGYVQGIPRLVDAVFIRPRPAQKRG